jgi:putative sigma-54 modulation protein
MKLHLAGKGLEITPSLEKYAEEKLGSLQKFVQKFDIEGAVELNVRLNLTTRHHQKGDIYGIIADLKLPKKILRAEDEAEDMHSAIDIARNKLLAEIEKYRTQHEFA